MNLVGYVISAYDGEPLPNAHVYVMRGGPWGTTSNLDGRYAIAVEPGELLTISYTGHETETYLVPDTLPATPLINALEPQTLDVFEVFSDPEPEPATDNRAGWGIGALLLLLLAAASSR